MSQHDAGGGVSPARSIDWKQGLAISMGAPLLVLPSIGYFANHLWAFAIVAWGLSVIQGFFQNTAYGELSTLFPKAPGMPGIAQSVFCGDPDRPFDPIRLAGGFSAWGYWFAWNPILAIFAILIGNYLHGLVPALAVFPVEHVSMVAGAFIFGLLLLINARGLASSALTGYVLAFLSLAPLAVIVASPFFSGDFMAANITQAWLPPDWEWDVGHLFILLGVLATAEWSACAWEAAIIYAPEYRNPRVDMPKALYLGGALSLVTYVMVQAAVTGALGIDGLMAQRISPLLPLAETAMGQVGMTVSIIMLIAAMVLGIQTAYLGSAWAMQSMAAAGNLPRIFSGINSRGTPVPAMIAIGLLNLWLISFKTPTVILGASAFGYVCANGVALFAFVRARRDPRLAGLERPFRAPRAWGKVALAFGLLNLPLYFLGVVYLNSLEVGWPSTWVAFLVLASYVPLWAYSRYERVKEAKAAQAA